MLKCIVRWIMESPQVSMRAGDQSVTWAVERPADTALLSLSGGYLPTAAVLLLQCYCCMLR